jgi:hypothetical protein
MFKTGGTAEAADSYRDAERTWHWDAKECAPPALKNNLEKERREELTRKRKLGETCEEEEDEELCAKVNAQAELRDRVKEAVLALGGGELQELDLDASDPNSGTGASTSKTKSERRAEKKQEERAKIVQQAAASSVKKIKKSGEHVADTGEEGVVIGLLGDNEAEHDLTDFDDDELDQYIRTEEEASHREVSLTTTCAHMYVRAHLKMWMSRLRQSSMEVSLTARNVCTYTCMCICMHVCMHVRMVSTFMRSVSIYRPQEEAQHKEASSTANMYACVCIRMHVSTHDCKHLLLWNLSPKGVIVIQDCFEDFVH